MSKVTRTTKRRSISHINASSTAKNTVRDVQASRAATAIERIPIEIMDQIFEEYVEMDQSACNLTFVSRTWWSLALANPWLWRYIIVTDGPSHIVVEAFKKWSLIGPSAKIWTRGKAQVCEGNDDFTAAVDRSRSVPIHISYWGSGEILMKQILTSQISLRVAG